MIDRFGRGLFTKIFGRESLLYNSASLGRKEMHIVHENIKRSQKYVNHILCKFPKKTCKYHPSQNKLMLFYGTTDHLSFYMIYVDFFGTLQRYSIVYVDMHNCFIYLDSNASLQK